MFRNLWLLIAVMGLIVSVAPVAAQEPGITPIVGEAQCMTYDCPPYLPAPCVCDYLRGAAGGTVHRVYLPLVLK